MFYSYTNVQDFMLILLNKYTGNTNCIMNFPR